MCSPRAATNHPSASASSGSVGHRDLLAASPRRDLCSTSCYQNLAMETFSAVLIKWWGGWFCVLDSAAALWGWQSHSQTNKGVCCFTAGLPFGKEALIPLVHQLGFWEAKSSLITSQCRFQNCLSAAGSAFSWAHISPLAQAAVPNCSGSQPTLSPFCFQVLMTVTSYFQPECFPTHGTANVQADLRSSFFPTFFWVLSSSKGDDELFQMPIRSS